MGVMDRIRTSTFRRVRTVAVNQSPFSGKVNRSGFQDWRWVFEFTYDLQTRAQAAPLLALIAAQGEGAGTFYVYDPDFGVPLSGYNGPGIVFGSGQVGNTLTTYSWPATTLIARAGDKLWVLYAGVGYRMFTVLADAMSLSAGDTLTFQLDAPLLRAPADTDIVGLNWFAGGATAMGAGIGIPVRLTGYTQSSEPGGLYSITLSGEEII